MNLDGYFDFKTHLFVFEEAKVYYFGSKAKYPSILKYLLSYLEVVIEPLHYPYYN